MKAGISSRVMEYKTRIKHRFVKMLMGGMTYDG